jgi:PAS domain S-box-containing protein
MGFRLKSFFLSLLIVIGTLGAVYAILQLVILQQFIQLESDALRQDAQRAQAAISSEQLALDQLTASWAQRPETIRIIGKSDRILAGTQINQLESAGLAVDAVVYFGDQGQLIYGRAKDPENGQLTALPAELRDFIRQDNLPLTGSKQPAEQSGFVQTSQGLWMVSIRPVNFGSSANLTYGFLTFGRLLDPPVLDRLSKTTRLNLALQPVNAEDVPSDFQMALTQLKNAPEQIFISMPKGLNIYRSSEEVAAFQSIQDLNGKIQSILRVMGDRHYYQQGLKSVTELGIVLLIMGLICAAAAYIYLDRSFISRLLVIDSGINNFRKTHDFTQQIEVEGKDELAQLAAGINATLVELGEHQEGQIRAERQFREALQNLSLAAVILDPDGRIVFCNDHLINISGWSSKDIVGHFWCSRFIPPDEQASCRAELLSAFKTGRITAHEDVQIMLRSGTTRMFSWSNTLLSGSDETVTGIVRIGEDVTELRKAEAMLRNSLRETRLHLSRLTALRSIDSTITSSMDTS